MKRRTAAALLITRGAGQKLEVFLAERSPELRFFGGYWALPGGTVDPSDFAAGGNDDEPAAMRQCARRELFEETGLLHGRLRRDRDTAWLAAVRRGMTATEPTAATTAATTAPPSWSELAADLESPPLREVARIETPPFAPVRYDTVFFHVPLGECTHGEPEIWQGELVQGRFQRPADALAAWRHGDIYLVPPVVIMLEHLAAASSIDEFATAIGATAAAYQNGRLHQVRFSPGIVLAPLKTPTLPPATTTNCYVVGNRELYVIDPGSPEAGEQQRLDALLTELSSNGGKVAGIVLTHHHPDHVGGVHALSQQRDLPVHGHPLTLSRLAPGFRRGRELEDGDTIALGDAPDGSPDWQLTALHTPGHDRGHLVFRESRYGTAIVGDMLSTVSTIIIDPPEGHLATYLKSLERLAAEPITTLYPAHGPAVRNGQRLINQYTRHRRQRETALVKSLAEGGGTVAALLPKVYWDADPKLYPFAARSLLAGLEKLAEEGRARCDGDVWTATEA